MHRAYHVGDSVRFEGFFGLSVTQIVGAMQPGANAVQVQDAGDYSAGDTVVIDPHNPELREVRVVASKNDDLLTLTEPLEAPHGRRVEVWRLVSPTDPKLRIHPPKGEEIVYQGGDLQEDGTGQFSAQHTVDRPGSWLWRWQATDGVIGADEGSFSVQVSHFA